MVLGVGIAPRHHCGALGDAQIRLPQLHPVLFGQLDDPSERRMQQLGVGREGDVLGLDGGIHGHSLEVAGPQRATPVRHPQALGQENFQLSPSRFLQWLRSERSARTCAGKTPRQ
jgi:hypothetical protein